MVVAAGCLAALLIAVGFVVGRLAIDIERDVDPARVMVGEPAGALLTARNPGRRPTRSIVVDEHIGDADRPGHRPDARPGRRAPDVLPTADRPPGPGHASGRPRSCAPTRSVCCAAASATPRRPTLWVHPRWSLVDALPSGFAKDLEGPTSDASPAGDIAFHALRPYQLGDDRRHIHWMSTARSGTLMVRHYVDNRRPTLAVMLARRRRTTPVRRRLSSRWPSRSSTSLVLSSLALRLPIAARSTSEWLLGRLRPQGRDGMLETLTLVERTRRARRSLVLAAAELRPRRVGDVGDRRSSPAAARRTNCCRW